MKQRVATDERPFQTTTNGSGAGRDSPSEPYSDAGPEATLVSVLPIFRVFKFK